MTARSLSADARAARQPTPFEIGLRPDRDVVYVKPVGELDLATSVELRDQVDELVRAGFTNVVIDLRALVFIDCAGVRSLLALDAAARRVGWRLALIPGGDRVRQLFALTATLDDLPFAAPGGHSEPHRRRSPTTPYDASKLT